MRDSAGAIRNPEFDPRIRSIPTLAGGSSSKTGGANFYRGRLETAQKVGGDLYRLQFLYNPTSISVQSTVELNVIGDQSVVSPLDTSTYLIPMQQNVSFSLLFDRTYETWEYNERKEESRLGVLSDIKYLYAMLGMLSTPDTEVTSGADGGAGSATATTDVTKRLDIENITNPTPLSFHQYIPMWAVFGPHQTYYGFVSSIAVTYSHWTQRMIPNRCAVNVGFTLLPPGAKAKQPFFVDTQTKQAYQDDIARRQHKVSNGAGVGGR